MTFNDLVSQIERRFGEALANDVATNDRLAYFAEGFLSEELAPGNAPLLAVKDLDELPEWHNLGVLVSRRQANAPPAAALSLSIGPVSEQS